MKRRAKRRVVRTAIVALLVGAVVAAAVWRHWAHPDGTARAREQADADRRVTACQDRLQPMLHGHVESWLLTDTAATAQGARLSFTANIDGATALYECEVTYAGQVLAAGPVQ